MMSLTNIARSPGDPRLLRSGEGSSLGHADRAARALGWFSLGLGLFEVLAPGRLTRGLGLEGREGLVRAYGAREVAQGLLALSFDKRTGMWGRVAGDLLDIAAVLPALRAGNPRRDNAAIALLVLVGVTAIDIAVADATTVRHARPRTQPRSYRGRSGFPRGIDAARGAARAAPRPRGEPATISARAAE